MNFSVSNIGWNKKDDDHVLNNLSELGVKHIEIAPSIVFNDLLNISKKEIIEFKNKLEKHDLNVISFQSLFYQFKDINIFFNPDESFEILKKIADLSNELGCKNLVFGSPKNRDIKNLNPEDVLNRSSIFFNKVGNYLKANEIILSIEPNPTIYGCNFLNTTKETSDYLRELNNPNIKLNLDLGTIKSNHESVIEILTENLDLINHIHISEPYLKPFKNSDVFKDCMKYCKDFKYEKFLSLEMRENENFIKLIKKIKKYFT